MEFQHIKSTGIFFKSERDPVRLALTKNQRQTRKNNLLRFARPEKIGYEKKDLNIKFFGLKKSSGYSVDEEVARAKWCKHRDTKAAKAEDLIYKNFPSREWIRNGFYWKQMVSLRPTDRSDAVKLDLALLRKMKHQHTIDLFICSTRRNLLNQAMDEVIRSVILDRPTLGLFLLKCRDEIYSSVDAIEKLWLSEMALGMRKGILLEKIRTARAKADREKEEEMKALQTKKKFLTAKIFLFEENSSTKRFFGVRHFMKKLTKIQNENMLLKKQLMNVTNKEQVGPIRESTRFMKPSESRLNLFRDV